MEISQLLNVIVDGVSTNVGTTGQFSFSWNNGPVILNGNTSPNLPQGNYTVDITDHWNDDCVSAGIPISIPPTAPITFNMGFPNNPILDHPTCSPGNDGSITNMIIAGGTPYTNPDPYDYLWSDGSTNLDLTNVSEGTYTLTVTDANGCIATSPAYTLTCGLLSTK